jgi:hypothetical protein
MPIVATHRGVGIHAFQTTERIASVVRPAIDHVFTLDDPRELMSYVRSMSNPPEARLFAKAKLLVLFDLAVERREARPKIDRELVEVITAGLESLYWADPASFCALLDAHNSPDAHNPPGEEGEEGPAPRDAENSRALEKAQDFLLH